MKAFWWFEEGAIAGMARPGFNEMHWGDLPYDEALLLGWLGQYSCGHADRQSFSKYLSACSPKVSKFYNVAEDENREVVRKLESTDGIHRVLKSASERTQLFENFDLEDSKIHIRYCGKRIHQEIETLRDRGIKKIITLTEKHHSKDRLEDHFELHHFSIEDLNAPTLNQVQGVAEILKQAKQDKKAVAVHCLAGIGRTSTVLIAAHMTLGECMHELKKTVSQKNPFYQCVGSQAAFIDSIHQKVSKAVPVV